MKFVFFCSYIVQSILVSQHKMLKLQLKFKNNFHIILLIFFFFRFGLIILPHVGIFYVLIFWSFDRNQTRALRYDVRGALYDLKPHEAPPGGYGNRLEYLTSEEQRAEQLCEEERYLYLYHNAEEEILYQGKLVQLPHRTNFCSINDLFYSVRQNQNKN